MDLDAIKGVGPATKEKLHEAGVTDVASLAEADAADVSEQTGISVDRVKKFVMQAQGLLAAESTEDEEEEEAPVAREPVPGEVDLEADGTLPAGAVGETPRPVATRSSTTVERNGDAVSVAAAAEREAARAEAGGDAGADKPKGWKVVLRDRSATARVDAGEVTYENLPIVTAKADESEDAIMKEIGYNAVLLKEGEHAAFVRVNGHWETGIPLFKERSLSESGTTELVRVRVHEIRERGGAKSKAGSEGRVAGGGASAEAKPSGGGLLGLFKKKA